MPTGTWLEYLSPSDGIVLGGFANFRRWDLAKGK